MSSTQLSTPKSVNAMTLSSPSPWNIPQQDSAERAFNKLTRTFAAQMSALKEYRSKGEQKMTVQHVRVAEVGQAIVGNVNATPEGVGARMHWPMHQALRCHANEAEREAVPFASRSRS